MAIEADGRGPGPGDQSSHHISGWSCPSAEAQRVLQADGMIVAIKQDNPAETHETGD